MARRKQTVATIRCPTDVHKLNRIAEASGLTAEHAENADQFRLVNSGRNLAAELQPALWQQASARLDEAVKNGAIPNWSAIDAVADR